MSLPAASGHVWKPTAEGMKHQVQYDDNKYDDKGRLKARCGARVTPVFEQPACPDCMVESPATELADVLEARTVEAFSDAVPAADDEGFRRDR